MADLDERLRRRARDRLGTPRKHDPGKELAGDCVVLPGDANRWQASVVHYDKRALADLPQRQT